MLFPLTTDKTHAGRRTPFAGATILLSICLVAGCYSRSQEDLLADADAAIARGDYTSAAIQLKNVLQENPDLGLARLTLGRVAFKQRDYASAEKEFNRALDLGVSPEEVAPLLARAMVESGRAKDAVSRFSSLRLATAEAQAMLDTALGYASLAANDLPAAEERFEHVLSVRPRDADALTGKARVLAAGRNLDAGSELIKPLLRPEVGSADAWMLEAEIRSAKRDRAGAVEALREVYKIRPDDVQARATVVSGLITLGKYDDARTELIALKKVAPSALENDYLDGLLLVSEGKYAEARPSIDKVLSKAPEYLPAIWLSATVNYNTKSYAQAEQQAEKLIARGAGTLPVRKVLIGSYLGTGRIAKAQQVIEPLLKAAPNDPEVLAIAGQIQLAAGESDVALKSLELAAKATPTSPEAQARLGMVRLATGDYTGGIDALKSASLLDDGIRPDILLVLAHLRQQKIEAALAAISAIELKAPAEPIVHNLRAAAYLLKRDEKGARASYEAALKLQPMYFPAASNLARLDIAAGDSRSAAKRFESVLAHDPRHADALMALAGVKSQSIEGRGEAEALLRKAVKEHPDLIKARVALVQYYTFIDEKAKALDAARAAVADNPRSSAALELLAQSQASQGDVVGSVATRAKVVENNPNDVAALTRLAAAQAAAGKFAEAEQSYKKALLIKPDAVDIELMLAGFYRSRKLFDEALSIAKGLQKRYPKNASGFLLEGDILLASARRTDAVSAFKAAYARERSSTTLMPLLSVLDLSRQGDEARALAADWMANNALELSVPAYEAEQALARSDFDRARSLYQRILKIAPENVVALNNLSWLLWKSKDADARRHAQKAYELAPENPAVLDTYGLILAETGDVSKGLALLTKAIELSPQAEVYRLNYARALILGKRNAEARVLLEKLAAQGSKSSVSNEAAELLKSL